MKKSYEVFLDGDYYSTVEVELQKNGFPPHYIVVDERRAVRVKTDSGHIYVIQ